MMLLPASDIHTFINCNTIPDDMMGLDSTDDDAAANEVGARSRPLTAGTMKLLRLARLD